MTSQPAAQPAHAAHAHPAGAALPALRLGLVRYFRELVIDDVLCRRPEGAPLPRRRDDLEPIERLAQGLADEAMRRIADALEHGSVGADAEAADGPELGDVIDMVVAEVEREVAASQADADITRDRLGRRPGIGQAAA